MKHAFARLRLVALLLVAVAPLFVPAPARAEVAEARAAVMLRDRPQASGKVVDRIASGSRLTMIEMSADGAWARVRTKAGKEGWVPVASIRTKGGGREEEPDDTPRNPDDAIAKRRNVRPEAWVNKSKYHEDDNKMTVVAQKAELFGRPQASGTVLGIVRRGEVVTFVRKSADKKWVQIDIGAGELAWVDARAVRMGSDMPRAGEEPDEPPPTRRPFTRREEPDEPPPTTRRREEPREEPPPPRSRKPAQEPSPEEVRRTDRDRDEEPPPGARKPNRREEARREEPVDEPPPSRRRVQEEPKEEPPPPRRRRKPETAQETPSSRPKKPPHGNNYVDVRVKFGFAKTGEQYRTNGTSTLLLTNYEYNTTNLGVGVQLGYSRAIGKLRIHIDGKYLLAAAGVVDYANAKGQVTRLGILDQNFGGGLAVGGFFDVAGGIDLRLRLGAEVWVNQISPSNPPISISQDIVLGMAIGLEFAMPEVLYFGSRPFGFRLKGGAVVPATRIQQPNLKTGPNNSTTGGYFGAAIAYGLFKDVKRGQLFIELGYELGLQYSHYSGQCPATITRPDGTISRLCRDDTVDDANSSSIAHLGTVGLYYQY